LFTSLLRDPSYSQGKEQGHTGLVYQGLEQVLKTILRATWQNALQFVALEIKY
jgi:hypothetical protein